MLKMWNASLVLATGMLAILGTFLVRSGILDSIHAFGASTLGIPFVSLIAVMIAGSIALVVSRRADAAQRAPARLAAVARGGLPRQQPRARRAVRRDLLGHVLPAHLRGGHGRQGVGRPAVVRPLHVPLALVLVLLSGHRAAHRLAPRVRCGRPAQPAGSRARRRRRRGRERRRCGAGSSPPTVRDVRLRRVRARRRRRRSSGAARARAARCPATGRRARWSRSCAATAAATAATSSTSGMALMFIGIAASSALQDDADANLRPGQSDARRRLRGDATCGRRRASDDRATAGWRRSNFGSVLDVRRDGEHVATLEAVARRSSRRRRSPSSARSAGSSRARRRARSA